MKKPSVLLAVCAVLMAVVPAAASYDNNLDLDMVNPLSPGLSKRGIRSWLHDKLFPSEIDVAVITESTIAFEEALSEAQAKLETLSNEVEALNSDSGLFGAFRVHSHYQDFYRSLEYLSTLSSTSEIPNFRVTLIDKIANDFSVLLKILNKKHPDFVASHTVKFSERYITEMATTTFEIYENLINQSIDNCKALSELKTPLESLARAFRSSFTKFAIPSVNIPEIPKCRSRRSAVNDGNAPSVSELSDSVATSDSTSDSVANIVSTLNQAAPTLAPGPVIASSHSSSTSASLQSSVTADQN